MKYFHNSRGRRQSKNSLTLPPKSWLTHFFSILHQKCCVWTAVLINRRLRRREPITTNFVNLLRIDYNWLKWYLTLNTTLYNHRCSFITFHRYNYTTWFHHFVCSQEINISFYEDRRSNSGFADCVKMKK